jgi:hypothetical protein
VGRVPSSSPADTKAQRRRRSVECLWPIHASLCGTVRSLEMYGALRLFPQEAVWRGCQPKRRAECRTRRPLLGVSCLFHSASALHRLPVGSAAAIPKQARGSSLGDFHASAATSPEIFTRRPSPMPPGRGTVSSRNTRAKNRSRGCSRPIAARAAGRPSPAASTPKIPRTSAAHEAGPTQAQAQAFVRPLSQAVATMLRRVEMPHAAEAATWYGYASSRRAKRPCTSRFQRRSSRPCTRSRRHRDRRRRRTSHGPCR